MVLGKTTTMNMITGFLEPSRGQIMVNGIDVDSFPIIKKRIDERGSLNG